MHKISISHLSCFFILVLLSLPVLPASAQTGAYGPKEFGASYSTPFARYYAPYALQAAAAYTKVGALDATLVGPDKQPPSDGSDVTVVIDDVFKNVNDPDMKLKGRATNYLRPWQYQFGHEGYLGCFDTQENCYSWGDWARFSTWGGPSFHVWARRQSQNPKAACTEVSIAFRGTDPSSWSDLIADADPVTGYVTVDSYRQLRRNIDAIVKKITTLHCYRPQRPPQIVAVGHSLGGGLAQLAGLANRQIVKVFAFDSSPFTGAGYVQKKISAQNAEGLEIDRVYQNDELLQYAKPLQQFPYYNAPCVRYVAFGLLKQDNALKLHNMSALAREIVRLSYRRGPQDPFTTPESLPNCKNRRYVVPDTDEEENDVVASNRYPRYAGAHRGNYLAAETRTPTLESPTRENALNLFQDNPAQPTAKRVPSRKRFVRIARESGTTAKPVARF